MERRVVITGMGVVNASGQCVEEFWKNISLGKSCITHIPDFEQSNMPTQVAGKIYNFKAESSIPRRFLAKVDTFTKYAWVAADMAIKDANLDFDKEDRSKIGVWLGNNAGGWDICERGLYEMYREGPLYVNPWQATAWFLSSPQGYLTIAHNIQGMSKSFACDRASSASALYAAVRNIKSGVNDIILSGGTEAPITPFAMNCYYDIGEMVTTKSLTNAYKPFDSEASGLLIGEGAAILILEEREHAIKRGANILGEITSATCTTDANPQLNTYFRKSIENALEIAKVKPENIDVIYGEGAADPELDFLEADAINQVFAKNTELLATFPKSGFGHLYGASTVTDFVSALLGSQHQAVVPTPNHTKKSEFVEFTIPNELVQKNINNTLINSRAREGNNFSFVLNTEKQEA